MTQPLTGQLGTPFSRPGGIRLGDPGPTALAAVLEGGLHGWGALDPVYSQVLDIDLLGPDAEGLHGQGSTTAPIPYGLFGTIIGRGTLEAEYVQLLDIDLLPDDAEGVHGQGSTEAVLTAASGIDLVGGTGGIIGQGAIAAETGATLPDIDLLPDDAEGLLGQGSTEAPLVASFPLVPPAAGIIGQGALEPEFAEVLDIDLLPDDAEGLHGQGSTEAAVTVAGGLDLTGGILGQGSLEAEYAQVLDIDLLPDDAEGLHGQGSTAAVVPLAIDHWLTGGTGGILGQGSLEPEYAQVLEIDLLPDDAEGLHGQGSTTVAVTVVGSVDLVGGTGGIIGRGAIAAEVPAQLLDVDLLPDDAEGLHGQGATTTIAFGVYDWIGGSILGQGTLEAEYVQLLDIDLLPDDAEGVQGQGSTGAVLSIPAVVDLLPPGSEGLHGQGSSEAALSGGYHWLEPPCVAICGIVGQGSIHATKLSTGEEIPLGWKGLFGQGSLTTTEGLTVQRFGTTLFGVRTYAPISEEIDLPPAMLARFLRARQNLPHRHLASGGFPIFRRVTRSTIARHTAPEPLPQVGARIPTRLPPPRAFSVPEEPLRNDR